MASKPRRSPPQTKDPTDELWATAEDFGRWIVWREGPLLAVHKPAGILSQGGEGRGSNLVDLARAFLGSPRVGVLHRLDRNVTGLVLLCDDGRLAGRLHEQFREGKVERRYRAVVRGRLPPLPLRIDAWLRKRERDLTVEVKPAPRGAAARSALEGQGWSDALTLVHGGEPFEPLGEGSWELELEPVTGRSHQLRAHLAWFGLPIVGDPRYGVCVAGRRAPMLHAERLRFVDPRTARTVELHAVAPWRSELRSAPGR